MKQSVLNHEPAAIQTPPTTNKHLIRWVEKMAELCRPDAIHWVDGSQAEYDFLCDRLVDAGTFTRLDPEKVARMLLRPLRSERCCPRRRPHLYLFPFTRRRRTDQ